MLKTAEKALTVKEKIDTLDMIIVENLSKHTIMRIKEISGGMGEYKYHL